MGAFCVDGTLSSLSVACISSLAPLQWSAIAMMIQSKHSPGKLLTASGFVCSDFLTFWRYSEVVKHFCGSQTVRVPDLRLWLTSHLQRPRNRKLETQEGSVLMSIKERLQRTHRTLETEARLLGSLVLEHSNPHGVAFEPRSGLLETCTQIHEEVTEADSKKPEKPESH